MSLTSDGDESVVLAAQTSLKSIRVPASFFITRLACVRAGASDAYKTRKLFSQI
jgi:hypothetical protein